jgi:hypothetical protein
MTILDLLDRSSASDAFRDAVTRFARDGRPNERLAFNRDSPAIKVERTLVRALEEYPDLQVESIEIHGMSGCEFFRGVMDVHTAAEVRRVSFHWDCKWKAQEMGWHDYFGFPDQTRAAREFPYACFRTWTEEGTLLKNIVLAGETDAIELGEPVPA